MSNLIEGARRRKLPDRRPAFTFEFEHAGLRYSCTFGRYADGRVAEVFVQNHKSNSSADTTARDCAIACSIALQFGASLQLLQKAFFQDSRGRPASPVGAALDIISKGGLR
jgi:hypothetical protein